MRIAAIDCGSNSFHLLIADAYEHDQMVVIEDDKSILNLGAEVASTGVISDSSVTRAKRVMRHYKTLIERHNVEKVKCVATSAIRSANNGGQVIESLSKSLGFPVVVISGNEEAETIFRAISAVSTLPETRVLGCDMGGGSLELMAGQRYGLESSISVPLGASRIAREYKVQDPISKEDIQQISKFCRESFKEFTKSYPPELFSHIVASSGTLTSIIFMARAKTDGFVSPPLSLITANPDEIIETCEEIISLKPKKRLKIAGYEQTRHEYMPTACVIALEICKLVSKTSPWMVSPYALREGIVLKIMDEQREDLLDQKQVAEKTVDDLENRMAAFTPIKSTIHGDVKLNLVKHGEKVSEIAGQLFDGLAKLHNLKKQDRKLLQHASRLHDIGETISHSKHDQHGAYILSSIPMLGFSPTEANILRGLVRWHRQRDPKISDRFVGRLDDHDFNRALWLTSILRIADGSDSGKAGVVDSVTVTVNPDVIFIRFVSEKDCELELYSARRKRNLLEKISGKDVVIEKQVGNIKQAPD